MGQVPKKIRLIMVEGLPASGKSTAAANIAKELLQRGNKVICVDEGVPDHPADYDNYDFPDFETERNKILSKWKEFVEGADKDTIYIFNCIFLQNPMCETMMRFNMSENESCHYICEIADIIHSMNPMIYYIKQSNERAAIENVLAERGKDWLNAVISYHVDQGYGKQNNLKGYDGYLACLEERQCRELRILRETKLDFRIVGEKPAIEDFMNCLD